MANTSIKFAIKSISTEEFATIKNCYKEQENVGIETGYGFGINPIEHAVFVNFSLMFKCQENPFIIMKVSCGFSIEEEDFLKFENKERNTITIPKGFLTHLTVLTIGTARGILHAKLDKSGFEQFILPTLNISDMFKEDMEFELSSD
ncbi:hypothetical protein [Arthrospiribacter ruber]|uniref:Uncharacterized protein n=1 Tax=Arthrospiribacter ruber TaxID=2487934 RepID=A0A951IWP4_9BACT|nr:hypothetical protein [Arthrospiribacter ruber]MBW3467707.1 hypothetical protein [Arthrospiribacter ruber]